MLLVGHFAAPAPDASRARRRVTSRKRALCLRTDLDRASRRRPSPSAGDVTNLHLRSGARSAWANTASTSSAIALATLQLQRVDHIGPGSAGLRLIPFSLGVILGSRLAAPVLARSARPAVIAVGLAAIAVGNLILAVSDGTGAALLVGVAISGLGIGVSSVAATSLAIDVPATLQATAAGATNTAAQLGTALGVATLLLLAAFTDSRWGWAGAAAIALAASVLAMRDRLTTPLTS